MSDQPNDNKLTLIDQRLDLAFRALGASCRHYSKGFEVDDNNRQPLTLLKYWMIGEHHKEAIADPSGKRTEYSIHPEKGILLMGGVGTGKTAMMRALSHAMNMGGGSGFKIANAIRIVKEYNSSDGGDNVVLEYAHSGALCIDDLGAEEDGKHYGKITNVIADIIALRYENRHTTHFTSNSDTKALLDKYDERTLSRINEMASIIPLSGQDRRTGAMTVPHRRPNALFMPDPPPMTEEQRAASKEQADAAIKVLRDHMDEAKRQKREEVERKRREDVEKELKIIARETTGNLAHYARFHPFEEIRRAAKDEIARRTTAPLQEVYAAADKVNVPQPDPETEPQLSEP